MMFTMLMLTVDPSGADQDYKINSLKSFSKLYCMPSIALLSISRVKANLEPGVFSLFCSGRKITSTGQKHMDRIAGQVSVIFLS